MTAEQYEELEATVSSTLKVCDIEKLKKKWFLGLGIKEIERDKSLEIFF